MFSVLHLQEMKNLLFHLLLLLHQVQETKPSTIYIVQVPELPMINLLTLDLSLLREPTQVIPINPEGCTRNKHLFQTIITLELILIIFLLAKTINSSRMSVFYLRWLTSRLDICNLQMQTIKDIQFPLKLLTPHH